MTYAVTWDFENIWDTLRNRSARSRNPYPAWSWTTPWPGMLPGPPGSGATSLPWSQCPRYILECSNAKAAAFGFFHLQQNPYAMQCLELHQFLITWVCLKMLGTPLYPMVLLIIIPFLNGYFIGNIHHFQTHPLEVGAQTSWQDCNGNSGLTRFPLWEG